MSIKADEVQRRMLRDCNAFSEWLKRATPEEAFAYYETDQTPKHLDMGSNYWVMLNRVRDSQNARMGFFSSTPPVWQVKGSTHDKYDRDRARLIKNTMKWQGDEAGLIEELNRSIFDSYLCGMGGMHVGFNVHQITSIDTIGCLNLSWRDPMRFRPDSKARKGHTLDGGHFSYIGRFTKSEFESEFGAMQDSDGKPIDIDKIFEQAKGKDTIDFMLNLAQAKGDEETIVVIEHEYWRTIKKKVGNVEIPWREYRIALVAGLTTLTDEISPVSDANTWGTILFYNQPLRNLPFSSSDFQSEKQIQDLINTMLSMSINNQARQMSSPILAHDGSLVNEDYWKKNASKPSAILRWKYTPEMMNANIPPGIAKPSRMGPGNESPSWMQTLMWVSNEFQNVSMKDVMRGEQAPGVTSGIQLQQLQSVAIQPTYFAKQKLLGSLQRMGHAAYLLVKNNITEEVEIPVDDEGLGDERGVIINHRMSGIELTDVINAAAQGDKNFEDAIAMLSVRQNAGGDDEMPISIREWCEVKGEDSMRFVEPFLAKIKGILESEASNGKTAPPKDAVYRNDITFGNYRVSLSLDPTQESNKILRQQQGKVFTDLMIQLGAPKTALKYFMKISQEPEAQRIIEDLEKEIAERQAAMAPPEIPGMSGAEPTMESPAPEEANVQPDGGDFPMPLSV